MTLKVIIILINIADTCIDVNAGKVGSDIGKSPLAADAFMCYNHCRSDDDCNYWSYIEPSYIDPPFRKCYLKSQKDWTDFIDPAKNGIISGAKTKKCPGFGSEENSVFNSTLSSTI